MQSLIYYSASMHDSSTWARLFLVIIQMCRDERGLPSSLHTLGIIKIVVELGALLPTPACTGTVELFGLTGLLTRRLAQCMLPGCAGSLH